MFDEDQLLNVMYRALKMLPSLSTFSRRSQDLNKSGWWCLRFSKPLILILIFFFCKKGCESENKYRKQPNQKLLFLLSVKY